MKQKELMNVYVANLATSNVKLHNLHWNVVGESFERVHVYLEKLYDDVFLKFDEVAERIKMMGEFPLASLKTYLDVTSVEELGNKEYPTNEAIKLAKAEVEALKNTAQEIRTLADGNDDFVTVAMMEDHVAGYDKEIWFMASALK